MPRGATLNCPDLLEVLCPVLSEIIVRAVTRISE